GGSLRYDGPIERALATWNCWRPRSWRIAIVTAMALASMFTCTCTPGKRQAENRPATDQQESVPTGKRGFRAMSMQVSSCGE
ncbi:hypothetical protein, partial [Methylibium sp. T29-B]|uniref:hypothetical protein n=1 Tax=Methylibium sp. T29-B TaxID=1437443 RepID=UPI001E40B105